MAAGPGTSLSRQLLKLSKVDLYEIESKKRYASILFDPKEAAAMGTDAMFALGKSGLDDLISVNEDFAVFEKSLFSVDSKNFERAVQPPTTIQRLDRTLSRFLLLLSPYLHLSSASNALEWLVRQYRIHIYNQNDFMLAILPFHETNIFARMLQVFDLSDTNGLWSWLRPLQKNGLPLTRDSLLRRCSANRPLLQAICEQPFRLDDVFSSSERSPRLLVSFCTGVMVGVLDSTKIKEDLVAFVMQFVVKGMKSTMTDLKFSSTVIVGFLVCKSVLTESVTFGLINLITKNVLDEIGDYGLLLLSCVCETQTLNTLPSKSVERLGKLEGLVDTLSRLMQKNNMGALLRCLVPLLVAQVPGRKGTHARDGELQHHQPPTDQLELVHRLLLDLPVDPNTVSAGARAIFENYLRSCIDMPAEPNELEPLRKLYGALHRRHPTVVEKSLDSFVKELQQSPDSFDTNYRLLQSFIVGSIVDLSKGESSDTQILLCLQHPDPEFRKMAVHSLLDALENKNQSCLSPVLEEAFLGRLHDSDVGVALFVLDQGLTRLERAVSRIKLGVSLLELLRKRYDSQWKPVLKKVTELLSDAVEPLGFISEMNPVLFELLPSVLFDPWSRKINLEMLNMLASSKLFSEQPLAKALKTIDHRVLSKSSERKEAVQSNVYILTTLAEEMLKQGNVNSLVGDLVAAATSLPLNHPLHLFSIVLVSLVSAPGGSPQQHTQVLMNMVELHLPAVLAEKGVTVRPEAVLSSDGEPSWGLGDVLDIAFYSSPQDIHYSVNITPVVVWALGQALLSLTTVHCKAVDPMEFGDRTSLTLLSMWKVLCLSGNSSMRKSSYLWVFRNYLIYFLKNILNGETALMSFLTGVWLLAVTESLQVPTHPPSSINSLESLVCSLYIFKAVCIVDAGIRVFCQNNAERVILPLFCLLLHDNSSVREAALVCLLAVSSDSPQHPLLSLAGGLSEQNLTVSRECTVLQSLLDASIPLSTKKKKYTKVTSKPDPLYNFLACVVLNKETPLAIAVCVASSLSTVLPRQDDDSITAALSRLVNDSPTQLSVRLCEALLAWYSPYKASSLFASSRATKILLECINLWTSPSFIIPSITMISPEFYSQLNQPVQVMVLRRLVALIVENTSSVVVSEARHTLRKVPIIGEHFLTIMEDLVKDLKNLTNEDGRQPTKRQRKNVPMEDSSAATAMWKKASLLIELIQPGNNVQNPQCLVPALFAILSSSFVENEKHPINDYAYLLQITSLALYDIVLTIGKLRREHHIALSQLTSPEKFQVEQIVKLLRATDNVNVQKNAFLLLGAISELFPDAVLHNIMSIFTFMGNSLMRLDDSHSFSVIVKTIQAVVPSIEKASTSSKPDRNTPFATKPIASDVLAIFADIAPHIPLHRRLPVFNTLLTTLGGDECVTQVIYLLIQRQVIMEDSGRNKDPSLYVGHGFCSQLLSQFSPKTQLAALTGLLLVLLELPSIIIKDSIAQAQDQPAFCDLRRLSVRGLFRLKLSTLTLVCSHLRLAAFQETISCVGPDQDVESMFGGLFEAGLKYITQISKHSEGDRDETHIKIWKALLHKTYELLAKVACLLSLERLLSMVGSLVQHENQFVRRKSLELLCSHVVYLTELDASQSEKLLDFMDNIPSAILKNRSESVPMIHVSVFALTSLAQRLAAEYPDRFKPVLPVLCELVNTDKFPSSVVSASVQALADIASHIRFEFVSCLPLLMPRLLALMADLENRGTSLVVGTVTSLRRIVSALPNQLTGYLVELIRSVCLLSLSLQQEPGGTDNHLSSAMNSLIKTIAENVSPALFSRKVKDAYILLLPTDKRSLVPLIKMLDEHVLVMPPDHMQQQRWALFDLLVDILSLRVRLPESSSFGTIEDIIEVSAMNCVVSTSMKLPESTFREHFLKIVEWATQEKGTAYITLFRLLGVLADRLKGLFLLFAGHVLKLSAELLTTNQTGRQPVYSNDISNDLLLCNILNLWTSCFKHDKHGFVTKDRYDCLIDPLIDQLDNTLGGMQMYKVRAEASVVPCIGHFSSVIRDDLLWRPLQLKILAKLRHKREQVRFFALATLEEFYVRLGEVAIRLLPEAIPYLAEVLEDESPDVEKRCQQCISKMETVLGEPLQKYF